jgi:hypothetical protein
LHGIVPLADDTIPEREVVYAFAELGHVPLHS